MKLLHRVVPVDTTSESESWWSQFHDLNRGWNPVTWRDPLDPEAFPLTSGHWHLCQHGAQLAGLARLEVIWHHGGIYVDSDMEPLRPLDPLGRILDGGAGFAAWEDRNTVPDAMFGAPAQHPAVLAMIVAALDRLVNPGPSWKDDAGPWSTGPGVFTTVLPGRADWLLLPPGSLYPYHYSRVAEDAGRDHRSEQPWAFAVHHWAGSWLPPDQRPANRRARPGGA